MTALAVSAMMTLAMPFASFAASRSCQTGFRPGNNCGYTTDTNAISMVRTQGGCVISNGNAIGLYTVSGKGYPSWGTGKQRLYSRIQGMQLLFRNKLRYKFLHWRELPDIRECFHDSRSVMRKFYQCTIGNFLLFSMTSLNKIGL